MMKLKILGTGSRGNCYILTDSNDQQLMIDCGIPIKEIKRGLDYNLMNMQGVLISHEHKDHSLSASECIMCGFPVYMAYDNDGQDRISHFGDFVIQNFKVPHNDTECHGFYIKHRVDNQRILYLTDLSKCPYSFRSCKVHHIMIECNYQKKYIDTDAANFQHKCKGHMSLSECIKTLKINQTGQLKTVVLIHGGQGLNPNEAIDKVQKTVGDKVKVIYAEKGMEVELC